MEESGSGFFDALVLFERSDDGMVFLKAVNPIEFDLDDELELLLGNCFSCGVTRVYNDIVYFFTTKKYYCYTWVFHTTEGLFSIVILSKCFVARAFFELFKSQRRMVNERNHDISPISLMDGMHEEMLSWRDVNGNLVITIPEGEQLWKLTQNQSMKGFDPFELFNPEYSATVIWKAVLLGERILVRAANAAQMSAAICSVISLIQPFAYKESMLVCVSNDDPRLDNLRDYRLVGVTESVNVSEKLFEHNLWAYPRSHTYTEEVRENIEAKTKRVKKTVDSFLDRLLIVNPYHDLLDYPAVDDNLKTCYPDKKLKNSITVDEFRQFELTETFHEYRKSVMFRDKFRHCFLGVSAEEALRGKSKQHLVAIREKLAKLIKSEKYRRDEHLVCVFKTHRLVAKKMIQDLP